MRRIDPEVRGIVTDRLMTLRELSWFPQYSGGAICEGIHYREVDSKWPCVGCPLYIKIGNGLDVYSNHACAFTHIGDVCRLAINQVEHFDKTH
jgi:hypothetical protein